MPTERLMQLNFPVITMLAAYIKNLKMKKLDERKKKKKEGVKSVVFAEWVKSVVAYQFCRTNVTKNKIK